MYSLKTKNLFKSYGEKDDLEIVLENIDLEVDSGEFVTLLGPSGCGKSTLLHIMAGLEDPDAGELFCRGNPIDGPAADRVLIMQEAGLFPWLNVLQNVCFGLKERGISRQKAEKMAREELERVDLAEAAENYPHELSGGMQQRAALARGLVLKPEIILMDEPFAALDEQTRLRLQRELIDMWQKRDMTILFVTHSIREALLLSERVLVMASNPGKIKKEYELNFSYPRRPGREEIVSLEKEILNELAPSLTAGEQFSPQPAGGGGLKDEKYSA